MKVSIALATYNGENFLQDQLNSITDQTQLPDELVVSDDCSTDDTLKIIGQFAKMAPFPVKVIQNGTNIGQPRNFGRAFEACTGDLIFFCDQDNSWHPNRIERICEFYKNNQKALVVTTDAYITNQNLSPLPRTLFERGKLHQKNFASLHLGCCMAFRSSILPIFLPLVGKGMSLDGIIHYTGLFLGQRHVINEPLLYFRRHSKNVSESLLYIVNLHSFIRIAKSIFGGASPDYQPTISTFETIVDNIESSTIYGEDQKLIESSKSQMRSVRLPYRDRQELFSGSFIDRKIRQVKFYRRKEYQNFDRWRSLLLDLFLR